jgi:hypothetical protein
MQANAIESDLLMHTFVRLASSRQKQDIVYAYPCGGFQGERIAVKDTWELVTIFQHALHWQVRVWPIAGKKAPDSISAAGEC